MNMRLVFLVFILYGAISVWAQVHTFLNVQVENDYINWWGKGTDRFYTGGNFLSIQWLRPRKEIRLLGLEVVQKTYTPSNLQTTRVEAMDYPYAGLLFLRHYFMVAPEHTRLIMLARISYGTSGPRSGVARLQKRIHHWIGDEVPQGWATMQSSAPFGQVDFNINYPVQLSSHFSLGIYQQVEGGTFLNRWVGQGWFFWGQQPLPIFAGIDGIVPLQLSEAGKKKKIYTGLLVSAGLQHVIRDRIIEEADYNKTLLAPATSSFFYLQRTTPLVSGNFLIHYQQVSMRLTQHWQPLSIHSLPNHFFGAIGLSFQF